MKQGRNVLKLLGVTLLAALGMMAVSLASAQAAEHFAILKEGKLVDLDVETPISGLVGAGELLTAVLSIQCTEGHITGNINPGGVAGTANASVLFLGCTAQKNPNCIIYPSETDLEKGTNAGHITATGVGRLDLHEVSPGVFKHFLEIEGLGAKELFAKFYIHGELCPLEGTEVEITGLTALLLPTALEHKKSQTVETVDLTEEKLLIGKNGLFNGKDPAHFKAGQTGTILLLGQHEGAEWGVLP